MKFLEIAFQNILPIFGHKNTSPITITIIISAHHSSTCLKLIPWANMLVLSVEFQLILMEFAYFSETNIEIAILCFRRGSVPKWVAEQSIRYSIPFLSFGIIASFVGRLLIYWTWIQFETNGQHEWRIIYNHEWIDVNQIMSNKLRKHSYRSCHEIDCAFVWNYPMTHGITSNQRIEMEIEKLKPIDKILSIGMTKSKATKLKSVKTWC